MSRRQRQLRRLRAASAPYLPGLGSVLSTIALTGFLAYVIGQAVIGRKVGIGETWDGTKRHLPAIAGAVAVTFVGAVLLVAVVLGLPLRLAVGAVGDAEAGPIMLTRARCPRPGPALPVPVDAASPSSPPSSCSRAAASWSAFARSWRLTAGTPFWRILGIRLAHGDHRRLRGQHHHLSAHPRRCRHRRRGGRRAGHFFMWQAILAGVASLVARRADNPVHRRGRRPSSPSTRGSGAGPGHPAHPGLAAGGPAPWPSAARTR